MFHRDDQTAQRLGERRPDGDEPLRPGPVVLLDDDGLPRPWRVAHQAGVDLFGGAVEALHDVLRILGHVNLLEKQSPPGYDTTTGAAAPDRCGHRMSGGPTDPAT